MTPLELKLNAYDVVALGGAAIIRHDPELHRAIKVVSSDFPGDPPRTNHRQIESEMRIYDHIGHHAYVVDFGEQNKAEGVFYLRWMASGDLQSYLEEIPAISDSQRLKWCFQLASAVAGLHALHVSHCDIHPGNILLEDTLNIKLCDFGGSSFGGSQPLTIGGSSTFDPKLPFQILQMHVFALGSVCYLIQTGHLPYEDLSHVDTRELYSLSIFPDTNHIILGDIISDCWNHAVLDVNEVVCALCLVPPSCLDRRGCGTGHKSNVGELTDWRLAESSTRRPEEVVEVAQTAQIHWQASMDDSLTTQSYVAREDSGCRDLKKLRIMQ